MNISKVALKMQLDQAKNPQQRMIEMNLVKFNRPNHNIWPLESVFLSPLKELCSMEPLFDRLLRNPNTVSERTFEFDEQADSYALKMEFPGFAKKDVSVEIEQDILTVIASSKCEKKEVPETKRSVRLPEDVEIGKAKAKLENGILSIHLPKKVAKKTLKLKLS